MSGDDYTGGGSIDVVTYTGYAPGAVFDFAAVGADVIHFDTLEWVQFGGSAVEVSGTNGTDRFAGTATGDILSGSGGDDWLQGLGGADELFGGSGNDRLQGGNGDDTLNGGSSDMDLLEGGSGADTFAFGAGWGHDAIIDFADGLDIIDLVDAGVTGFRELRLEQRGSTAIVWTLTNSASIQLFNTNISALSAADFDFL
jgi:Ca2+-binding RTX toxin-like protein